MHQYENKNYFQSSVGGGFSGMFQRSVYDDDDDQDFRPAPRAPPRGSYYSEASLDLILQENIRKMELAMRQMQSPPVIEIPVVLVEDDESLQEFEVSLNESLVAGSATFVADFSEGTVENQNGEVLADSGNDALWFQIQNQVVAPVTVVEELLCTVAGVDTLEELKVEHSDGVKIPADEIPYPITQYYGLLYEGPHENGRSALYTMLYDYLGGVLKRGIDALVVKGWKENRIGHWDDDDILSHVIPYKEGQRLCPLGRTLGTHRRDYLSLDPQYAGWVEETIVKAIQRNCQVLSISEELSMAYLASHRILGSEEVDGLNKAGLLDDQCCLVSWEGMMDLETEEYRSGMVLLDVLAGVCVFFSREFRRKHIDREAMDDDLDMIDNGYCPAIYSLKDLRPGWHAPLLQYMLLRFGAAYYQTPWCISALKECRREGRNWWTEEIEYYEDLLRSGDLYIHKVVIPAADVIRFVEWWKKGKPAPITYPHKYYACPVFLDGDQET
jgi:hypothetical protein